ncbi:Pimeloyl-ACP methyl ester carboxylesterase [Nannocystis exedens]|uniref:Pimeloyl-ACP methyl ester carboxylesterase n=1 Tax=Nannocystis exedens TaxID=54 RepID=A0A1I1UEK5_9BACT|nr:alpha/beta fold hydrolase [Nannocystis exedens]PCC71570.1 2-hydroxy-6-oxononadienedioate/2-hydroxy-6-oxononatrienedioate hydrolase [Nannocystis exedens]SFD68038.1 Pimeloyl-ACP methyl ester carboxylesterase [Nannocystis exedens]
MSRASSIVRISVHGRATRYRRIEPAAGGPPLLLVHGLACSSDAFLPTLAHLAESPRGGLVLAADMPGYGESAGPRRALGIAELGEWQARFLDAVDVERAHVVGNSMGCQVALALARRFPERAASLTLIGPTTGDELQSLPRYALGLLADSLFESVAYNLTLLRMAAQMGVRRYVATVAAMLRDRPLARAQEVRCPVLVLRGRRDRIVPDRVAEQLAAALPDGRLVRVPRVAHALQFDRPAALCELLSAFVAEVEDAEAGDVREVPLGSRAGRRG